MAMGDLDLTPTKGMIAEAKAGLEWRSEHGRGGTAVGIARARDISNGVRLSPDTVMRMASFFARHEVDKKGVGFTPGESGFPSNGRIAWALWGGDAGATWSKKMSEQIKTARQAAMANASRRVVVSGVPLGCEPHVAALRFGRKLTPAEVAQRQLAAEASAEKRRQKKAAKDANIAADEKRRLEARAEAVRMAKERKRAGQQLRQSRKKRQWVREAIKFAGKGATEDLVTAFNLVIGEERIVPLDTSNRKRTVRVGAAHDTTPEVSDMSETADGMSVLARRAQTVRLAAAAYDESKHKRDATGKFSKKSESEKVDRSKERPEGWNGRCHNRGYAEEHPAECRGGETADIFSDEEWAAAEEKAGIAKPKPVGQEMVKKSPEGTRAKVEAAKKRQEQIRAGKAKASESARKVGR